jgi:two-component system NtrC family sensor kinase
VTPIPLRRELLISFAVLFAAALMIAVLGLLLLLPLLPLLTSPGQVTGYVVALLVADLAVLFWFGHRLLSDRFVRPMEGLTAAVGRIAAGDYSHRAAGAESLELRALEVGVNHMADRLIQDQQVLARNIESLDHTNAELVEARNQVIQSARLASVGTLAAGIAHEVGNPLGAILAYVDVARARAPSGEQAELLESIRDEARRIDRIVRSLLDYARPRLEESVAEAPRRVIERVRELLEAQGKLDEVGHEWHLDDDVPDVVMVPHRLEQVMVNLLLNAVDALAGRADGRIVVSLNADTGDVARLPFRREGDPSGINYMHRRRVSRDEGGKGVDPLFTAARVAVVTVEDNGAGIPEEDRSKVFDPFFTTKEPGKGTGLGLSICARLVEGMGGRIHLDRGAEGGARFTVRLPGATIMPAQADRLIAEAAVLRGAS